MKFDPANYLDLPVEKALERRPPIPAVDYMGTIQDVTSRHWQSKDKVDDSGQLKEGIAFDTVIVVDIPEATRASLGLTSPTLSLKDSIMLDLTASGAIDDSPGKNSRLRIYRDATDLNKAGEVFRARLLIGKMVKVRVTHRVLDSGDVVENIGTLSKPM